MNVFYLFSMIWKQWIYSWLNFECRWLVSTNNVRYVYINTHTRCVYFVAGHKYKTRARFFYFMCMMEKERERERAYECEFFSYIAVICSLTTTTNSGCGSTCNVVCRVHLTSHSMNLTIHKHTHIYIHDIHTHTQRVHTVIWSCAQRVWYIYSGKYVYIYIASASSG